jgi:hypothetical protein
VDELDAEAPVSPIAVDVRGEGGGLEVLKPHEEQEADEHEENPQYETNQASDRPLVHNEPMVAPPPPMNAHPQLASRRLTPTSTRLGRRFGWDLTHGGVVPQP